VRQTFKSDSISQMTLIIAKVGTSESLTKIENLIDLCLNKVCSGTIPEHINKRVIQLKKSMKINSDIISLKQDLGNFLIKQSQYPF